MEIRLFGSYFCEKCSTIKEGLNMIGISVNFIDALDDINNDLCDKNSVDDLPHIQIIDDLGTVLWEKIDSISLTEVYKNCKKYGIK